MSKELNEQSYLLHLMVYMLLYVKVILTGNLAQIRSKLIAENSKKC